MTRKINRKAENPQRSSEYFSLAHQFMEAAALAMEYEYWNAAGILIAHSAIAFSDALTIKFGGVKSHSNNHGDAVPLITELLQLSNDDKKSLMNFQKIIGEKNRMSYCGEQYTEKTIEPFWKQLARYKSWVKSKMDSRN